MVRETTHRASSRCKASLLKPTSMEFWKCSNRIVKERSKLIGKSYLPGITAVRSGESQDSKFNARLTALSINPISSSIRLYTIQQHMHLALVALVKGWLMIDPLHIMQHMRLLDEQILPAMYSLTRLSFSRGEKKMEEKEKEK